MTMGRKRRPWYSAEPAAKAVIAACEEARGKDPILTQLFEELKRVQVDQNRERRQKIKAEIAKLNAEICRVRASIRPRIKALNARILRLQCQYRAPAYPTNLWRQIAARRLQVDKKAGARLVRKQQKELIREYKKRL